MLPSFNASSGEIALERVEAGEHYDLIFMDQYMSSTERKLLGTETVTELRARGLLDCTICGLSANDMEKEFLEAGADAFLLKPLPRNKAELESELMRLTARIRAKRSSQEGLMCSDGAEPV